MRQRRCERIGPGSDHGAKSRGAAPPGHEGRRRKEENADRIIETSLLEMGEDGLL